MNFGEMEYGNSGISLPNWLPETTGKQAEWYTTLTMRPLKSRTISDYIVLVKELEKEEIKQKEYGSILILSIMEEVGEMARAYLAEHGRKATNVKAQQDETYKQELGDLLLSIFKLAIYKNINLDKRLIYTLRKIRYRKLHPKK